MKHSIKDTKTGRFVKQQNEFKGLQYDPVDRPIRKIGVTEVVITGVVLIGILVLVDMYIVKIF